jgi:hypothetical protein
VGEKETEMNVWEIELQKHYADAPENDWDADLTSEYRVIAPSYESALSTAESLAKSEEFKDDETGEVIPVDSVRLISIHKGVSIDAIAKVTA